MDCFELTTTLTGICIEKKIDLGNAILAGLGTVGLVIMVVQKRRHPGFEASPYMPGREPKGKGSVQSQDTPEYVDVSEPSSTAAEETEATSSLAAK